jgi:putative AlgH/UPF0301 family transcriptional regulator
MVNSWTLYGNLRERSSSNDQDKHIPFAAGGPLAHERRCKACDEAGGGVFSEYALKVADSIATADGADAAESSEFGLGYERHTLGWSMWHCGVEWSEAEDDDYDDDDDEKGEGEGFEFWV